MGVFAFWALILGFVSGVFLRSYVAVSWEGVVFLVLTALCVLWGTRTRVGLLIALTLFACSAGIARVSIALPERDAALDVVVGSTVVIEGIVFEEPDARENSTRLSVRTEQGTGVLVTAPLHVDVLYGDHIRAEGILDVPHEFETGPDRVFAYPAFLAKSGVLYTLSFAQVERVGEREGSTIKKVSLWIKHIYLTGLVRALPEPAAGLAAGITVGDKRGVGEELGDVFRVVGLTHIIVLSGYNITVVIYAFSWILVRLSLPRMVEFGVSVLVAIFFALITGLAAASVRAAAMAIIASVGAITGRIYLASRALALVAAGMILWNPYVLAFDPGFQLSILATAGLIAFSPSVASWLSFVTERFGFREIASATIATQCAVLPLLLYQSGQFNVFALPVNLLTLIVIPWAMFLSAVAAVFGLVVGPLAPLLGFPALALLSYVIYVAQFFAQLPFASIATPAFGAGALILIYVAIAAGYFFFTVRQQSVPPPTSN